MQEIEHPPVRAAYDPVADLLSNGTPPTRWFALYTASRHEKRVAQHLSQREIEFYLPLYKSERKWRDGSRVTLDLPLFPGYLFIHIRRSERSRVLGVLSVCIGIGPIGFVHLGLLADAIGASWATATTGIEGLVMLALTFRWWRVILT